jgi:hypothetical protein
MPVGFVILAFIVSGFLGSIVRRWRAPLATARSSSSRFGADGLGIRLPTGDTSKWNYPDVARSGRAT